jgi:hypothetical protein
MVSYLNISGDAVLYIGKSVSHQSVFTNKEYGFLLLSHCGAT